MTESLSADSGFQYIRENIKEIQNNIGEAAVKSGRCAEDITLMAVTKTVEPEKINYALENCGISLIGENKVQELLSKLPYLRLNGAKAHIIGHLQTNKVKKIIGEVSMIQSVDSVRLAQEIARVSLSKSLSTDILLEVNIGDEESKTGFDKNILEESLFEIAKLDGLKVRGLMCVPPICDNSAKQCEYFENMYRIFVDISAKKYDNVCMDILSMGMTGDYTQAVLHGSNLVRIGSGIFGARIY